MSAEDSTNAADGEATQPAAIPLVRPENIELPLHFDLGQTTATLALLQSLQPGYVFELPARTEDGVAITVNGAPLAKGQLVQVGDHLGVRVVEVIRHATDHA